VRIAVTSQNFRTITGHAGKTRRFLVFEAEPGGEPREVERLDLPKELSFHEYRGNEAHPVDGVAVIITTSAGAGFVHRLHARGISVVVTSETDPQAAVRGFFAGTLPPPEPHEHGHHHH